MNIVMSIIDRLVTTCARRRGILIDFYSMGFVDGLDYDPDDDLIDDDDLILLHQEIDSVLGRNV